MERPSRSTTVISVTREGPDGAVGRVEDGGMQVDAVVDQFHGDPVVPPAMP